MLAITHISFIYLISELPFVSGEIIAMIPPFTTKSGRIAYPYARKRIKEIGAKAGVPRFHAHAARHKCATMLLLGYRGSIPVDIRQVQIHLGHSSLATTQRYTHITSEAVAHSIKDVYNSVFRRWEKTKNGTGGSKMFVPAPAPDGADRLHNFYNVSNASNNTNLRGF